jgi:transcriptional regulator with XRE-family HTH domain
VPGQCNRNVQAEDTVTLQAHEIDVHVGARVRDRRKALGLSQIRLGLHLNLSFQQVQKYERGHNRISASKLYEIAQFLKVPMGFFFEGLPADQPAIVDFAQAVYAFLHSTDGLALGEAFLRLPSDAQRQRILDLMKAMADDA